MQEDRYMTVPYSSDIQSITDGLLVSSVIDVPTKYLCKTQLVGGWIGKVDTTEKWLEAR